MNVYHFTPDSIRKLAAFHSENEIIFDNSNTLYTNLATKENIKGKICASFIIDKTCKLKLASLISGLGYGLD